jgi:hypothetical protein
VTSFRSRRSAVKAAGFAAAEASLESPRARSKSISSLRIAKSEIKVGMVRATTKKKMPRLEIAYAIPPMARAAATFPAELNVWLRPCRRSNN